MQNKTIIFQCLILIFLSNVSGVSLDNENLPLVREAEAEVIIFQNNSGSVNNSVYWEGYSSSTAPFLLWNRTGTRTYNRFLGDNVGIGTTTPNYKLEVNSADKTLNVSNKLFVNSTVVQIGPLASNPGSGAIAGLSISEPSGFSGNVIRASVNTNEMFTINQGGTLGLAANNIVINPVTGAFDLSATHLDLTFRTAGDSSNADDFIFTTVTTGEIMRLKGNTGNVGIGTIIPTATLHVNSSSGAGSFKVQNGTGSEHTHFLINATTGRIYIGTGATGWASNLSETSTITMIPNNNLITGFQIIVRYHCYCACFR